ncbi:DUF4044 domain-containing protein [Fructilactobacillus sanfranciscensis]|uniref:DUF4044 domain-containing protein n=1 Tax=Fructilactobacillus sanfranciscensis TaxID=1625 RepID=A0A5C4TMV8_FRUSA|nr:DUF4044 domain-containing protein [Fructilactobacillus sanfranciscensis]MCG7194097.1 DUF4044 domain-containing protein [Fructilactobacillus sanfranciscensis]MCG7195358.1 DUF4044 domain-containing protein [Fructilactobacillus sanfranciscensis]MDN4461589.1 DUF4044 domain-containing protein [Fructilactobacillus sanfranciscensis]MVF15320.1 DUF4044 domain-containing protein [Fructilactobacillus sanfranciscensis]NDR60273.1 DUF4044 domain-containing protein [Fructilactobacillus sanfranciscensis]
MTKWRDKTTFQKILYIFVWIMIIITLLGVILVSASAVFENM